MSASDVQETQIPDEPSSSQTKAEQSWGRVLITGGTDWSKLGRKERGGVAKAEEENSNPDLLEPHILRSLSNVKATSVHTSSCGCHCVVLDVDGQAWLFGRNGYSALGLPRAEEVISENAPHLLRASDLGAAKGARFVHVACGRNHTLLVGEDGEVWSAGVNNMGQCGHAVCPEVSSFQLVKGLSHEGKKEHAVKVAAGITFSLVLTESGKIFSFGSGEHGQLGNGRTGEHITTGNKNAFDVEPHPILVRDLEGKHIVDISCGQQHSVAIDSEGICYVWGYNGYCRLGLGNQVDALKPKVVPQFAGPNERMMGAIVAAGPSSTIVVDRQGMFWMAGKWKNSGEGSSGSPYSSFRYMQDIMACKISLARSGGVTHWALTPDDDGSVMTIAWGQNAANGELGLGPGEPKSATKPTRNIPLVGIDIIDIAAGQNTTLFIARPNAKLSDLPRHPEDVQPPLACVVCEKETGDDDSPLECEKCDYPYHLGCLDPPLTAVPDGEWFCPDCENDPGGAVGVHKKIKSKGKGKSKVTATSRRKGKQDADEVELESITGSKRKALTKTKAAAPKRKKQ